MLRLVDARADRWPGSSGEMPGSLLDEVVDGLIE